MINFLTRYLFDDIYINGGVVTNLRPGGAGYDLGNDISGNSRWDYAYINNIKLNGTGATVNEFSIDGTMAGNSDSAVPTEKAVKTYVDGSITKAAVIQYQETSGIVGTAYTGGDWRTIHINTEVSDTHNIVSLSTSQFTLEAGTYSATGSSILTDSGSNAARLRIYNVTDTATEGSGPLADLGSTHPMSALGIEGIVVSNGTDAFELQIYPIAGTGTSQALSTGDAEVYASLLLIKIS